VNIEPARSFHALLTDKTLPFDLEVVFQKATVEVAQSQTRAKLIELAGRVGSCDTVLFDERIEPHPRGTGEYAGCTGLQRGCENSEKKRQGAKTTTNGPAP
jgi:hypothetical protein